MTETLKLEISDEYKAQGSFAMIGIPVTESSRRTYEDYLRKAMQSTPNFVEEKLGCDHCPHHSSSIRPVLRKLEVADNSFNSDFTRVIQHTLAIFNCAGVLHRVGNKMPCEIPTNPPLSITLGIR